MAHIRLWHGLLFSGAVELAGVGVALSIFNSITKLFSVPLLSITTSAVASAVGAAGPSAAAAATSATAGMPRQSTSRAVSEAVSSSLIIAVTIGLLQVSGYTIIALKYKLEAPNHHVSDNVSFEMSSGVI